MFKRLQGFIIGLLCAPLLVGVALAADHIIKDNSYPILINGVKNSNVAALNVDGYTYFQLRSLKETGLTVKFNETDNQIEITVPQTAEQTTDTTSSEPTPVLDNPARVTSNGLSGISYNGIFYAEVMQIPQKYNIMLNKKSDVVQLISKTTGQLLTANQTADGFIKDTGEYYYLNYNTVKSMLDSSPLIDETQSSQPSSAETLTPTQVDALTSATQDGMTGVTYNGQFYIEENAFKNKYQVAVTLASTGVVLIIDGMTGRSISLNNNINGYLKSTTGTIYLNFDAIQPAINGGH